MRRRLDNLKGLSQRAQLKTAALLMLSAAAFAATLAVPMARLQAKQALLISGIDAKFRLPSLRRDQRAFEQAGGQELLQELRVRAHSELPQQLSRVDLHGVITALAKDRSLQLETLSVGEFLELDLQEADDAVAGCQISLSAQGDPQGVILLVELLCQLGYPTVVRDIRLLRGSLSEQGFAINTTLELYQSIPKTEQLPDSSDSKAVPQ